MKRAYPMRPIAAVGVVVRRNDQVLIVRRAQRPQRGEWSLPGGAIELGERAREAARREIREECGLEIKIVRLLELFDRIVRDRAGRVQYHYVIAEFLADYLAGHLRVASDSSEACFISAAQLGDFKLRPEVIALLRQGL